MKRGDIVKVALQGDLGKPRPALVIQSDLFALSPGVIVLPLSSYLVDLPFARITIEPSVRNGLLSPSQIMIEKITNLRREKVGGVIGTLESEIMDVVDDNLALFLGLV